MSVYLIKNSWWVDFSIKKVRYRRRAPHNSRYGATSYEFVLRKRLSNGEPIDGVQVQTAKTFEEFSTHWFKSYVVLNNKASEQRAKEIILRVHLVPYFGKKSLTEIKTLHVEGYKAQKVAEGLSPKTINNHLMVLSKCLRTASDWEEQCHIPKFQLLKQNPMHTDFLNQIEIDALLTDHSHPLTNDMVLLAVRTGLRFGELRGLLWPDIDFDRKILTVRHNFVRNSLSSPKSNKERYIPITEDVFKMLLTRRQTSGFVFLDHDGGPIPESSAPKRLRAVCQHVGIRPINWHLLRHTFASQLASRGVSLRVIQELLGHSSFSTTLRYAHLESSALKTAVDLLLTPPSTEKLIDPEDESDNTQPPETTTS